jgi:hypothetical protein
MAEAQDWSKLTSHSILGVVVMEWCAVHVEVLEAVRQLLRLKIKRESCVIKKTRERGLTASLLVM